MINKTYTVSEITYKIKTLLEGDESFRGFVLKGEISNFVRHRTGHLYFNLKDENSQIKAIMFQGYASMLNFIPKDGDKVTVTGSISLYVPGGTYSINIVKMENDGEGELYLKYLELKKKLASIGWFDKEKKVIPKYPKRIGVVTSPTGAVIEDIKNTVNRRYRLTEIILYPALVQGINSSSSISAQIKRANQENIVDVLIVGRGGGSIEDLWGFNELETISAIYNSKIPIITAIGHETDDTLSDLVSDLRAPTPTAAAELATPSSVDLINGLINSYKTLNKFINEKFESNKINLVNLIERLEVSGPLKRLEQQKQLLSIHENNLFNNYQNLILERKNKLEKIIISLGSLTPSRKLEQNKKEIDNIKVNLHYFYNYIVEFKINEFNQTKDSANRLGLEVLKFKINEFKNITSILEKVNPLKIMERGFALVSDTNNKVVDSILSINLNDDLKLEFKDGKALVKVMEREEYNGK